MAGAELFRSHLLLERAAQGDGAGNAEHLREAQRLFEACGATRRAGRRLR